MSSAELDQVQTGVWTKKWANHQDNILCHYFETLSSTNDLAKEDSNIFFDPQKTNLILCEEQTNGRGRNKNIWTNPQKGESLISSWILFTDQFPKPILTVRVGLALYSALKKTWPKLHLSLKAPNDIYINSKKVAGILIETIQQESSINKSNIKIIIGIGLNVFSSPETLTTASSIAKELEASITPEDWNNFLNLFYRELLNCKKQISFDLSALEVQDLLIALNHFPLLKEKYLDIAPDGSLLTKEGKILWSEL